GVTQPPLDHRSTTAGPPVNSWSTPGLDQVGSASVRDGSGCHVAPPEWAKWPATDNINLWLSHDSNSGPGVESTQEACLLPTEL
nr:hypothetical protein [Tanacetum cinerariifolium]